MGMLEVIFAILISDDEETQSLVERKILCAKAIVMYIGFLITDNKNFEEYETNYFRKDHRNFFLSLFKSLDQEYMIDKRNSVSEIMTVIRFFKEFVIKTLNLLSSVMNPSVSRDDLM